MCKKCNAPKPPRTHHCSVCERCVLKMDHHCPWMNNCIGLRNQKSFLHFNFYTAVAAAWTLVRAASKVFGCMTDDGCEEYGGFDYGISIVVCIFCGLFVLFCSVMFCDQAKMIMDDTSTIDRKIAARDGAKGATKGESSICCTNCRCSVCFCLPCNFNLDISVEN